MNRLEEMKKEDSKNIPKYIIGLIICGILGGIVGVLSAWAEEAGGFSIVINAMKEIMYIISPFIPVISVLISSIVITVLYKKSRKQYGSWDGEDEDTMEMIEQRNSVALIVAQIQMVVFYIFIAVGFYTFDKADTEGALLYTQIAFFVVGFIANTIFITASQQKIVNFEKEMNPEKNGSIYDSKFAEKWLESCDEAERHQIYKAAYTSYKATSYACIGAWLVSLMGMILLDTGLFPVILVCAIWLASGLSYSFAAMKNGKK